MAKTNKDARPEPRLPKGLRDIEAAELRQQQDMLAKIRAVYERYGFEPLETPAFEYTDALGKFLPDQDRPNEGVFSFQEAAPETREPSGAEPWLSLRYDLTAPLARYVAQNYQTLPKPFRRYAVGNVWRNEKPGPGRFRQFMQFDADTVGAESVAADAEMCMLAADTLEALGIKRGDYVIKVNNRKILDGILEASGLGGEANVDKRIIVLRAIDKLDRLGIRGVRDLLGAGRKDESGDFTRGAGLNEKEKNAILIAVDAVMTALNADPVEHAEVRVAIQKALTQLDRLPPRKARELLWRTSSLNWGDIKLAWGNELRFESKLQEEQLQKILAYLQTRYFDDSVDVQMRAASTGEKAPVRYPWGQVSFPSDALTFSAWRNAVGTSKIGHEGITELESIAEICRHAGYGPGRIYFEPSVVRGLEYYTGPVFEADLTFEVKDEKGNPVRFGSVGGGGRYDDLVARFNGQKVPATGFSIGVSRLQAALNALNAGTTKPAEGPVVVTVMEKERIADYQKMVQTLRAANIRAELYLGNPKKFGKQLEYADKRGSPCVVIQGPDERAAGKVTLKDLIEGAKAAAAIKGNKEWKEGRPAQVTVDEKDLVAEVKKILACHGG